MKSYAFAVFSFNRMIVFHNFQNVRNFQLFLKGMREFGETCFEVIFRAKSKIMVKKSIHRWIP